MANWTKWQTKYRDLRFQQQGKISCQWTRICSVDAFLWEWSYIADCNLLISSIICLIYSYLVMASLIPGDVDVSILEFKAML